MSRRGWGLFALMSVVWGLPYLLIRVAVDEITPPAVVFVRVAVATLLLVPLCLARGARTTLLPAFRRWRPLLAYTVVEIAVPWLLLTHAETRVTSSLAGILVAATALVSAVLSWVAGTADRPGRGRTLGLVVGFAGVIVLLGVDLGGVSWLAVTEIGGVTICYALGPMLLTRYLADLPALGVVTASVALTAVIYVPVVLLGPAVGWSHLSAGGIASLAGLAVVCTALAFVGFFALIAEVGPTRAVLITYVNPAVALLLGVVVLSEPVTVGMAVGCPLILLGCALGAARARRRDGSPEPAVPGAAPVVPAATVLDPDPTPERC
ncbi:DMT family transporter [Jatrophihabitans sp. YIM 134969]